MTVCALRDMSLKRHVVVADFLADVLSGWGGWRPLAARHGDRAGAARGEIARAGGGFTGAAAEQDHILGNHFGEVLFLAVFIVVTAGVQAAFHVNLLAFEEVVGEVLGLPEDHVMPVGFLFPFSRLLVLPAPAGGDGKFRDGRAALGALGLAILAVVPPAN